MGIEIGFELSVRKVKKAANLGLPALAIDSNPGRAYELFLDAIR